MDRGHVGVRVCVRLTSWVHVNSLKAFFSAEMTCGFNVATRGMFRGLMSFTQTFFEDYVEV